MFLLTWMFRLGEALHPGPWPSEPSEGLVIGCMNPTGLIGKSELVAELPSGSSTIYAVSETHLSTPGGKNVKQNSDSTMLDSSCMQGHQSPHVPILSVQWGANIEELPSFPASQAVP